MPGALLQMLAYGAMDICLTETTKARDAKVLKRYYKPARALDLKSCSICLSCDDSDEFDLDPDKDFVVLCRARHVFHRGCIDEWCKRHDTCPLCREHVPAKYR